MSSEGRILLPNSSSTLEVEIANIFIQFSESILKVENTFDDKKEIPIRYMWDINRCQSEFLPFLAQALGVNLSIFESTFSEEQIRNVLKLSFKVHQIQGTVGSIITIIQEALGYTIERIDEGIRNPEHVVGDDTDPRRWALYRVTITDPIPYLQGDGVTKLVREYAPARCKLQEIFFKETFQYDGEILYDGTYTYGAIGTN